MENVQNAANVNSVNFGLKGPNPVTVPIDNKQQDIEDGDKKSMDALKWAGIIAAGAVAAGGAAYAVKHGMVPKLEMVKDEAGKITKKIGDKVLTFDKGVASLNGEKFTGAFKHNGCTLKYKDGLLQESVKKGEGGFKKVYEYIDGKLDSVNGKKLGEFVQDVEDKAWVKARAE